MKKICVLCDFDGTITLKDALYSFFEKYCTQEWKIVESLWTEGKIGSKECLEREFALVPNLNQQLIDNYLKTVEIDRTFKDFYYFCEENSIDLYIVSDGIDYFIKKILEFHRIKKIKIISNHGEFVNKEFRLSYPNNAKNCTNNLGTCKCNVLNDIKKFYNKVIFVGDGVSDFCVANKADILYAKTSLLDYCMKNNIKCSKYNNFEDIKKSFLVYC